MFLGLAWGPINVQDFVHSFEPQNAHFCVLLGWIKPLTFQATREEFPAAKFAYLDATHFTLTLLIPPRGPADYLRSIVRRLESLVPLVASRSTGKLVWYQNDCNATDKRCSVDSFLLPMIVRHTYDTVNSSLHGVDKAGQQSEMLSTPSLSDFTLPAVVIYTLPTPTFNPRGVAFPFILTFPHLQLVCSISIFWPQPLIINALFDRDESCIVCWRYRTRLRDVCRSCYIPGGHSCQYHKHGSMFHHASRLSDCQTLRKLSTVPRA